MIDDQGSQPTIPEDVTSNDNENQELTNLLLENSKLTNLHQTEALTQKTGPDSDKKIFEENSENNSLEVRNLQNYVPPTTTLVPPRDFTFKKDLYKLETPITFVPGTKLIHQMKLEVIADPEKLGQFIGDHPASSRISYRLIKDVLIEWKYNGWAIPLELQNIPHLITYRLTDMVTSESFEFEHYLTIRSTVALVGPDFKNLPFSYNQASPEMIIWSGVPFSYSFPQVWPGTFDKVIAITDFWEDIESGGLTSNVPFSKYEDYNITTQAYKDWRASEYVVVVSYDGKADYSSKAAKQVHLHLKFKDRMQQTQEAFYNIAFTVKVPTGPSFQSNLETQYEFYSTQSAYIPLPIVVSGTFAIDKFEATAVADPAFTERLSCVISYPSMESFLVYDGKLEEAPQGRDLVITITDKKGLWISYNSYYEVKVPVAPTLETAPTDFRVVAGFDQTYEYSSVVNGDPTTTTWVVNTELEESLYTFNPTDRNIIVKGSDSSFQELAGTTITITSTLSNALTHATYPQTVTIEPYVPPAFSEDLPELLQLYPGQPKTVQYPTVKKGSFDLKSVELKGITPQLTLRKYLSHQTQVGEQPEDTSRPIVEIYFPINTLKLEFGGTAALREAEMFGFYYFTFLLIDVMGNEEEIFQFVEIRDAIAPKFETAPPTEFGLTPMTKFSYEFPLITEGDLKPATAIITMTAGLETSLIVTQTKNEDNMIQISAKYEGEIDITTTDEEATSLFVKVRLIDEASIGYTDYEIKINVTPIFTTELQDEYQVYAGVPKTLCAIPEIYGSIGLKSLSFTTDPVELEEEISIQEKQETKETEETEEKDKKEETEGETGVKELTYSGGIEDESFAGTKSISLLLANTFDDEVTTYTRPLIVTIPKPPSTTQEVSSELKVKVGEAITDLVHLTVVEGTFSPATATWTMFETLNEFLIVTQTKVSDKTQITVAYDGSKALESLVTSTDLFLKVKIQDAIKRTSVEYETSIVILEADKTEEPEISTDQAAQVESITESLIGAPYFEPAPNARYSVFSNDDVFIELGDPIDPQGKEISIKFKLGKASEFLIPSGSNLKLLQNPLVAVSLGTYSIEVELSSEYEGQSLTESYSFDIEVLQKEIEEQEEIKEGDQVADKTGESQAETSDETSGEASEQDIPFAEQQAPVEAIEELTQGLKSVGGLPPGIVLPPMSNQQVELSKKSAVDIPAEKLFVAIPLAARLTSGVSNMKDVILRQREIVAEQALENATSGGPMPPEARIDKMTNSGQISIGFTSSLQISDEEASGIKEQRRRNRRLLAEGKSPEKEQIAMYAVKEEGADEDELGEPIMNGWEITSIGPNGITFDLNFTDPIYVSSGEETDLMLVQLDLSEYKDANGNQLPESIVKYLSIPTQMGSLEEAERVEEQGSSANEGSKTTILANAVVNLLMGKSLSKVWRMIEGLQMATHLPLLKITSPGNVQAFNAFFGEVAGLDVADVESTNEEVFYFPEQDPVNINYQSMGYQTTLAVENLGTLLYLLLAHLWLLPVVWCLVQCGKKCRKIQPLTNKASKYAFFSGTIRFLMEGYLDLCLFSLINIKNLKWTPFIAVTMSNYASIFIMVLVCGFPIFACFWYLYKMNSWGDDDFKHRWGSLLDRVDINKKSMKGLGIIFPLTYFVRRLTFSIVLVFWVDFLWGQIAIMCMISVALIIFNNLARPMDSKFATNMENFNEVIALGVLYCVMSLSEANPDVESRQIYGTGFIALIGVYLTVHISILLGDVCYKIKLSLRKKMITKCDKVCLWTSQGELEKNKLQQAELQKSILYHKNKAQKLREQRKALIRELLETEERDDVAEQSQPEQVVNIELQRQKAPESIIEIRPMQTTPRFGDQPVSKLSRDSDDGDQSASQSESQLSQDGASQSNLVSVSSDETPEPSQTHQINTFTLQKRETITQTTRHHVIETTRVVSDKVVQSLADKMAAKLIQIDRMNSVTAKKKQTSSKKYQATTNLTTVSETTDQKKIIKNEQIDLKMDSASVRPDFDFNLDVVKVKYQFKELSLSNISLDESDNNDIDSSQSKEL